jgi:site-specific recombinase XerD
VEPGLKKAAAINKELYAIQHRVETLFLQMKQDLVDFRLSELLERLKGKKEPPQTIMEYVELKIQDLQSRVDIDIAQTTFYKYKRTASYLVEFLLREHHLKNLPISRINKEFLEDFQKFLRLHKKNSHNSASALMNCLKTILDEPVKQGVIRLNPFKDLSLSRKQVIRDYLTVDEIKKLQQLKPLPEGLRKNRDIFLFACFTGLAYSDIKSLKGSNIIVDPDGTKHIECYRNKTNVLSYVPLLQVAEEILLRYTTTGDIRDFNWYVPSNQKLNAALKTLAKLAGIPKELFMHLGRHSFATTVTLSHGIPIESVSRMLGHSSLKHTLIYAKIVNTKVKEDMSKIRDKFSS